MIDVLVQKLIGSIRCPYCSNQHFNYFCVTFYNFGVKMKKLLMPGQKNKQIYYTEYLVTVQYIKARAKIKQFSIYKIAKVRAKKQANFTQNI